jgi:hypothetical protein
LFHVARTTDVASVFGDYAGVVHVRLKTLVFAHKISVRRNLHDDRVSTYHMLDCGGHTVMAANESTPDHEKEWRDREIERLLFRLDQRDHDIDRLLHATTVFDAQIKRLDKYCKDLEEFYNREIKRLQAAVDQLGSGRS